MKESIFLDCLEHQKSSNGKPFWDDLSAKYAEDGYRSAEQLRSDFRREKKRRGFPSLDDEQTSYEEGDSYINIVCSSKRIKTQEDAIREFHIDTDIWEVERFKVKTSEGYRRDRIVQWDVSDGKVTNGHVDDSGKMLIVPMYHVEVRLVKKKSVANARDAIDLMIEDAKKFSPKYEQIKYPKYKDGCLYEIGIPDFHYGRLCWSAESGSDYDIKIAEQSIQSVLDQLLIDSQTYKISRILFPIGNDYFNSDTKANTTTRGTPMQEDTRYQKTFRKGRQLAVKMIDKCSKIAPVDVIIVPGNHDETRSFFLGDALECWYHDSPNVTINNSPKSRKYYSYGKNLIGFTHGCFEKINSLPLIMAVEEPKLWAESEFREMHLGDRHHKEDIIHAANEGIGVTVRILRSLVPEDAWTFNNGYVGSLKAGEGFVWHPDKGLIAQFTASPVLEE